MSKRRFRVLLALSDRKKGQSLLKQVRQWGYAAQQCSDANRLSKGLESFQPHILLIDISFAGWSALEILKRVGVPERRWLAIVLLAEEDQIDDAVEAIKRDAADYCTKPLNLSRLENQLEVIRREFEIRRKTAALSAKLNPSSIFGPFVGASKAMRKVYDLLRVLATSDTSVLISGESGTGKELAVQSIHQMSDRRKGPLITLNCAALPKDLIESQIFGHEKGAFTGADRARPGSFELADGGILFLDEIAEMPVSLQPKLLRVLEANRVRRLGGKAEKEFDVRVLAATNRPPKQATKKGHLREDLYYRVNVFAVELPPLRRRRSDIDLLCQHFIERFNEKHSFHVQGIEPEARRLLRKYEWPGNVRELKNVIERAVVMTRQGFISPSQLPPEISAPGSPAWESSNGNSDLIQLPVGISLQEAEKEILRKTLHQTGGNKSQAARILQIDVKTVRHKIRNYGLI